MLKELSIKNFKSFNEEVTFSMEADIDKIKEYPDHIVNTNDNHILKVASIYGPNGGGKSNLLDALTFLKRIINYPDYEKLVPLSYKCVFSNLDTTTIRAYFVNDEYEIGYEIEVSFDDIKTPITRETFAQKDLSLDLKIIQESLNYRKKNEKEYKDLYERKGAKLTLDNLTKELQTSNQNEAEVAHQNEAEAALSALQNLPENKTILAILGSLTTTDETGPQKNTPLAIIKSLYEQIMNINPLETLYFKLNKEDIILKHKKKLLALLDNVDIKLSDIVIKDGEIYFEREILVKTPTQANQAFQANQSSQASQAARPKQQNQSSHPKQQNLASPVGTPTIAPHFEKRLIPFYQESNGTKKIFSIFLTILDGLKENQILYCDDMNSFLHPKLFQSIIKLFNSEMNKNCQLIFNSHEIISMNNKLFRRDEIWFAYKDLSYQTRLIPLSNITNYKGEEISQEIKYYQEYLEGRFGADPFIKKDMEKVL